MANAKTGIWSAIGAVLGGAAGAYAGQLMQQHRPSFRYSRERRVRARTLGQELEDAMVIGGSAGAVVGAFLGGTLAGEDEPPKQLQR